MRANISDELIDAIDEKIYLDLELHILNKKLIEAEKQNNQGFVNHLNKIILTVTTQRRTVNQYLRDNGVKIYDPENFYDVEGEDAIFVDYHYSQKVNGGYKEGVMRYWKAALKKKLKDRMEKYFAGGA